MKKFLAVILAFLLAVPLPVYAGSTPSDAEYANDSKAVGPSFNNTVGYGSIRMNLCYTTTSGTTKYVRISLTSDGWFSPFFLLTFFSR